MKSLISVLHAEVRSRKRFEALVAAQWCANGFGECSSTRLEHDYHNRCRAPRSEIAKPVFGIPELLEAILLEVDLKSPVKLRQVSRELKGSIKRSTPLQVKLGVKSWIDDEAKDGTYTSPFVHSYLGFKVTIGREGTFQSQISPHSSKSLVIRRGFRR